MTNTTDAKQIVFSDNSLLKRILIPYKENCHYLQNASVEYQSADFANQKESKHSALLVAKGKFSIVQSCYIVDTGHFNAVEFNICYNQLAYYLLAECVQHQLLDKFKTWDIQTYIRRQLSDILIVRFSSTFQKPICSAAFNGYVEIIRAFTRKNAFFIQTTCGFNDNDGGSATGSVLFVILNIEKK